MRDQLNQNPLLQSINDFFKQKSFHTSFPLRTIEKEGHYEITAELPGYSKKDIRLQVNGRVIEIDVIDKKNSSNLQKKEVVHVPFSFEKHKIKATCFNGLLHIIIPRKAESEIEIE